MKGVNLSLGLGVLRFHTGTYLNEKAYLTFTQKGNQEYNLNFILSQCHKFLSYIDEKDKSDHDMLILTIFCNGLE